MMRRIIIVSASFALLASLPASAATIVDATGDFLPTYIGPQNGDLDVTGFSVTLNSGIFHVNTTLAAPVGTTPGAFYVYGVNRGSGTAGFAALGLNNVLFDQVIIVRQNGSISTIGAGTATFAGNTIDFDISSSLLPSTGFTPGQYGWNVWPRAATTAAGVAITGSPAISDFAPNNATLAAVPEPATWAMMLIGFGAVGGAMRSAKRRQKLTVTYARRLS
jgi:hypothetical protein